MMDADLTPVPLVVGLDGTLVASDLWAESVLVWMRTALLDVLRLPLLLANGRADGQWQRAGMAQPEVATLPYRPDVVAFLQAEKGNGRTLVLATTANDDLARKVAEHVGLFDRILAREGDTHRAGEAMAARLVALYGEKGFDYAGSGRRDLAACRNARKVILVEPSAGLLRGLAGSANIERVFEKRAPGASTVLEELRWRHWLKNALVLVPLLAAHRLHDPALLRDAALAFAAFSLCASSVYLFNDLLDLSSDRAHPHKKDRPLASGRLSMGSALMLMAVLLGSTVAIGRILPPGFLEAIATYFALNVAYCLGVKDVAYLDALVLGTGYSLRLVAGAAALDLRVSPWLLLVSLLFFFGLALLKRYAEIVTLHAHSGQQARVRGYAVRTGGTVFDVGIVSGLLAILFLALYGYVVEHQGRHILSGVGVCAILLFWTIHMWRMARLGRIVGDPVAFAYRDRSSQIVAVVTLLGLVGMA
jgi:4-hydroxybenzoate polyprenyltransferase